MQGFQMCISNTITVLTSSCQFIQNPNKKNHRENNCPIWLCIDFGG